MAKHLQNIVSASLTAAVGGDDHPILPQIRAESGKALPKGVCNHQQSQICLEKIIDGDFKALAYTMRTWEGAKLQVNSYPTQLIHWE